MHDAAALRELAAAAASLGDPEAAYLLLSRAAAASPAPDDAPRLLELLAAAAGPDNAAAARRLARLGADAGRDAAGARVWALSDLHIDQSAANLAWIRSLDAARFAGDVLIVAGDAGDTLAAVRAALAALRPKFRRVFFCAGNHDLWLLPGSGDAPLGDSLAKLFALHALCEELDVDSAPALIANGLAVAPLCSWYNQAFDASDPAPGRLRYDKFCRWPVREADVWQLMLSLNRAPLAALAARRPRHVIAASHFLPARGLPFPAWQPEMAKATGCVEIGAQLRGALGRPPDVHVHGHTHLPVDVAIGGTRHVHAPLLLPAVSSGSGGGGGDADGAAPMRCVWDGRAGGGAGCGAGSA
jgi:predicted phosphodiesterase